MAFNEQDVNREADGKFGEKVGSAPSVELDYSRPPVRLDMEYDEPVRLEGLDGDRDAFLGRVGSSSFDLLLTREPREDFSDPLMEDFIEREYGALPERGELEFTATYSLVDHPENDAEELSESDLSFLASETGAFQYDSDIERGTFYSKYLDYVEQFGD